MSNDIRIENKKQSRVCAYHHDTFFMHTDTRISQSYNMHLKKKTPRMWRNFRGFIHFGC